MPVRISHITNRTPAELGIMQKALAELHKPYAEKTDESALLPIERLMRIRQEMGFLKKHAGTMSFDADSRMATLNTMEDEGVTSIIKLTLLKVSDKQPVESVDAVLSLVPQYNALRQRNSKLPVVQVMYKAMADAVQTSIRKGVNNLITAVDMLDKNEPDDARVKAIDAALKGINAEIGALTGLSLDSERVAALKKKISLLDSRISVRVKSETELVSVKNNKPDLDAFRKTYGLMLTEQDAIRSFYTLNPSVMNTMLAALDARITAFKTTLQGAADTAIRTLDEKTSTPADVDRAERLLRSSLNMSLGINDDKTPFQDVAARLMDPEKATAMARSYALITKVRLAAVLRENEANAKRIAVEQAVKEKETTAKNAAVENLAAEKKPAATLAHEKSEVEQNTEDETPLNQEAKRRP